jgi:hypothetical protein
MLLADHKSSYSGHYFTSINNKILNYKNTDFYPGKLQNAKVINTFLEGVKHNIQIAKSCTQQIKIKHASIQSVTIR